MGKNSIANDPSSPWRDDDALSRLAAFVANPERDRSSHWAKMLSDFSFTGGRFSGLDGFGRRLPRSLPTALGNHIMQTPYRRMGRPFPRFPEVLDLGRRVAKAQGRLFDLDILRQVLTAALLDQMLNLSNLDGPALVIGDGFGTLASLLLALMPRQSVMLINLTPVLLVDLVYIHRVLPDVPIYLAENREQLETALASARRGVIALRADDQSLLQHAPISLAANVSSMHEMQPEVVARYFHSLRTCPAESTAFYCCNRLRKVLPDGSVTQFKSYPWSGEDTVLVDEFCPWHQQYYTCLPPRYRPYDGPIQHRLALLKKNPCEEKPETEGWAHP